MSNDVKWVNNTLGKGAVHNFITAYLKEYDNIYRSMIPDPPRRTQPGPYFINFIYTCRKNLLSNPRYYHYTKANKTCTPMLGPNLVYSLLLKIIVHNAKKYGKSEAVKIHELLFWFEEQGITQLVVVPLDKFAKKMFEDYSVRPGYTEQEDGTLGYCSLNGTPVETGGMEISNTRVNELLDAIYRITQTADDVDVDVGGKRRIHKTRRTRRRRDSARTTRRRTLSTKRTRTRRLSTKRR